MKKIVTILCIYLLLLISSQSCEPYHLLITNIRFESATLDHKGDERLFNTYNATTVFTKDIVFIISYQWYEEAQINYGLSSACYAAFDRGRVYDNEIKIPMLLSSITRLYIWEIRFLPIKT